MCEVYPNNTVQFFKARVRIEVRKERQFIQEVILLRDQRNWSQSGRGLRGAGGVQDFFSLLLIFIDF